MCVKSFEGKSQISTNWPPFAETMIRSNLEKSWLLYCLKVIGIDNYRILPIKGASPNKGAPHSLGEAKAIINVQNAHSFLNNCPIFNPKTPLESSEPQLSHYNIRCDLAKAPGALIRQNTVLNIGQARSNSINLKNIWFICFLMNARNPRNFP